MVDAIATANVLGQWFAASLVEFALLGLGTYVGFLLTEWKPRRTKRGKR